MEDKVQIKIPKADEKQVAKISPGKEGLNSDLKNRLDKIDQVLYGIMLAVVLSLVAIIVSVIGLFLDQMRFNNAAYREYSEKIQTIDSMKEINNELLRQNKQNQELILIQQNQMLELLNKQPQIKEAKN